jgi:tRNA pseudouridine55 synthase
MTSDGRVLLLDKPVGPTSFDCVAAVRRAFGERRVGHAGTLDPLASGLLVVCIGAATRLVPHLMDGDKRYRATIRLGRETVSGDLDGETAFEASAGDTERVGDAAIAAGIAALTGRIVQRPPVYSAIKVDGKPLYVRARAGEDVVAPERTVDVHRFELLVRDGGDLSVEVDCSKGTYIRSLAIDLGRRLAVGAHLTALRRTRSGAFDVDDAVELDALRSRPEAARTLTPWDALSDVSRQIVAGSLEREIRQGKTPEVDWSPGLHAVATETHRLVALVSVDETGRLRVIRGFAATDP